MKFYKYINNKNFCFKIKQNKLTAIIWSNEFIWFLKNGETHNSKNAAIFRENGYKVFYLKNKYYGNKFIFSKKSWRKLVRTLKLQAFL